jgi:hypothetical protein
MVNFPVGGTLRKLGKAVKVNPSFAVVAATLAYVRLRPARGSRPLHDRSWSRYNRDRRPVGPVSGRFDLTAKWRAFMPAIFDKLGIRFQYPENWTIDEKEALEGNNSVTVYSPGGAFWSIVFHGGGVGPKELAAQALKVMKKEYEQLDAESVQETVAGHKLTGYDLNFYCLDLTNTALIRAFRTASAAYLILCQADDREFDEVEGVFRAITASCLVGLA